MAVTATIKNYESSATSGTKVFYTRSDDTSTPPEMFHVWIGGTPTNDEIISAIQSELAARPSLNHNYEALMGQVIQSPPEKPKEFTGITGISESSTAEQVINSVSAQVKKSGSP